MTTAQDIVKNGTGVNLMIKSRHQTMHLSIVYIKP